MRAPSFPKRGSVHQMVQFALIGAAILRPERRFERALGIENQRLLRRIKAACARAHVDSHHAARKDRTRYGAGNNVLL